MHIHEEGYGRYRTDGARGNGDPNAERSTGELLKDLVENARILASAEVRLAKAELKEEAKKATRAGAAFGAGGVLLHTTLLLFAAFLVALLALAMPVVVAALIVTVLFGAAGAGAMFWAKKKVRDIYPDQTVRTLKEDKVWAKDTMQSVRLERRVNA